MTFEHESKAGQEPVTARAGGTIMQADYKARHMPDSSCSAPLTDSVFTTDNLPSVISIPQVGAPSSDGYPSQENIPGAILCDPPLKDDDEQKPLKPGRTNAEDNEKAENVGCCNSLAAWLKRAAFFMLRGIHKDDPWDRKTKLEVTAVYCATFLSVGFTLASLGPIYLSLKEQVGVTLSTFGWLFTSRAAVYLLSSVAGGYLFEKYPGNPLLSFSLVCAAIGNIIVPSSDNIPMLLVGVAFQGVSMGFLDTGANLLLIRVHGKDVGPYMQTMHFCYTLGCTISPLIVRLVMSLTDDEYIWAFYVFSLVSLVAAFLLMIIPSPNLDPVEAHEHSEKKQLQVDGYFGIPTTEFIISFHCALILFLYVGMEVKYGAYIVPYSVDSVGVTESDGQYLSSLFWGSLSLGRFFAVPLSARLSSRIILGINFITCIGAGCLVWSLKTYTASIWAGSVILGICMGPIFPGAINLAGEYVDVSGPIASILVIGAALGESFVPIIVGQMIDNLGYYVFLSALVFFPVSMLVTLISLTMFTKAKGWKSKEIMREEYDPIDE